MKGRDAVRKGVDVGKEERGKMDLAEDEKARGVMFGQRAR